MFTQFIATPYTAFAANLVYPKYEIPSLDNFGITLAGWRDNGIISDATYEQINRVYLRVKNNNPTPTAAEVEWVNVVKSLPLGFYNEFSNQVDYEEAKKIVDKKIFSKKVIKNTILDYVAASNNNEQAVAPTIMAWGAPGTGKTNLGKTWAQALNRTYAFVSCAGCTDAVFFKGSARVWIGAQPGVFVQSVIQAGCMNPGIMLDELEKATRKSSTSADPTLPLYAVLDPEQNNQFVDDYLGFPIDLSRCAFFATGNSVSGLTSALLDRMTVVYIPGYTKAEKKQLWDVYIYDRFKKDYNVDQNRVEITDDAKEYIVKYYSPEQGSRQLEKVYGRVLLNAMKEKAPSPIDLEFTKKTLGRIRPVITIPSSEDTIGVASGVYNPSTVNKEATIINLGAIYSTDGNYYSYLASPLSSVVAAGKALISEVADMYGMDNAVLSGGISWLAGKYVEPIKDPILALPCCVALFSLYTSNPVKKNSCFIGEIDSQGKILYTDNLQFYIQTASSLDIEDIYVSAENEDESVEYEGLGSIKVHYCKDVIEVLAECLNNDNKPGV